MYTTRLHDVQGDFGPKYVITACPICETSLYETEDPEYCYCHTHGKLRMQDLWKSPAQLLYVTPEISAAIQATIDSHTSRLERERAEGLLKYDPALPGPGLLATSSSYITEERREELVGMTREARLSHLQGEWTPMIHVTVPKTR